jgi:branched-chain amino acid transport system permease protein
MELAVVTGINIIILSCMYILVALGFAFLFSMLGIVNFAHGAIYMVGGYIGYILTRVWGLNSWVALPVAIIVMCLFGVFMERYFFRPFVGNFNIIAVACVIITVVLQTTVNIFMGTRVSSLPPFVSGALKIGSFSVSYERIVTVAIAIFVLAMVSWFVTRTKWGLQMQAISQNREGAALQGISIHGVSALACAIGCGLAGLSGCLMGAYTGLVPFMGDAMLVKVLILVILAGIGNINGVYIAGFILGGLNAVLPVVLPGAQSEAATIGIVIVLLLFRPQGFFGREVEM